jgi:hypothetical protein
VRIRPEIGGLGSRVPIVYPRRCEDLVLMEPHASRASVATAFALVPLSTTGCGADRSSPPGAALRHDPLGKGFRGWAMGFAPNYSCAPIVTISVIDSERYAQAPYDADLADRVCPGGALHNVAFLTEKADDYLGLVAESSGVLHVDEVAVFEIGTSNGPVKHPGNATTGFSRPAFDRSMAKAPWRVRFAFRLDEASTNFSIQGTYPDLCAADAVRPHVRNSVRKYATA